MYKYRIKRCEFTVTNVTAAKITPIARCMLYFVWVALYWVSQQPLGIGRSSIEFLKTTLVAAFLLTIAPGLWRIKIILQ